VETPAPTPADPEDVVTALETAAIFAAKGDSTEAARWLGRAADFAILSGNGARAETLARSARALSEGASAASGGAQSVHPLPTPPPRRASVRPMPPSERPHDVDHGHSQPMLLVRPASSTPAGPAVRASSLAPRASSAPASNAAPALNKESQEVSAVREASPLSLAPPKPVQTAKPTTATAESPKSTPKPPTTTLAESPKSTPKPQPSKPAENPKSTPRPSLHHELHRPFRLQGARVSLAPSQGSSRFYVMKVLEEGEPVTPGEHEAFVVLVDPNATR
jgi:hypothetical protein